MRKSFIAANWKMNNTVPEALKFVAALASELKAAGHVDVVIAPPFTALYSIGVALAETEFKLAAQNIFWEDSGAYTGEISGLFLRDVGCSCALIGHSERRQLFGETDETANRRFRAALRHGLIPILCVGETLGEREANRTWDVIERQLKGGLMGMSAEAAASAVVAYEPVWAIGTGRTATPEQAQEVHALIRRHFAKAFGAAVAENIRIIYGGSVKPSNSRELLSKEDIDGALVGGASLDPKQFAAIVRSAH
ncbi:MAG: triose-phosphate isomerase [Pseudomonadota bacterium]